MSLEKPDFSSFEATISALFSRVRGHIEPGAHRMQSLLPPEIIAQLRTIPTILVGGTNGKGTTCALLEKTFRNAGLKTALYTSPHLVCPTERVRINGRPISREDFLSYAKMSFSRAQSVLPDATFFELITSLAFQLIADKKPDVFICEVGLGGRLDSTNILSPQVSVVTGIGLDHTEWLGPTEEHIAYEKAFISRRNRPLIVGSLSPEAQTGLKRATCITGAKVFYSSAAKGTMASENLERSISLCQNVLQQLKSEIGIQLPAEDVSRAAREMHWPGRFDLRIKNGRPLLLDAAHNPDGLRFFLKECEVRPEIQALPRPHVFVYASLADKNWHECLQLLSASAQSLILTQTRSQRAVPSEVLLTYTQQLEAKPECAAFGSSAEALDHAVQVAKTHNGSVFILGSLTLVGEAMEHFALPVFAEFKDGD